MDVNIILKMRGVTKSFGATKALRNVDLDIYSNEVHAIVGSNGAGKSTLMKTLMGEHKPDEGSLHYLDNDITGLSPFMIQKNGIQIVHQVLNVVNSMSILENILLGCPPIKNGILKWKDGEAKVKEIIDFIGVDLDIRELASSLSVAKQQFVALARALINKPKVLILDEPTSRISLEETEKLFDLIKKLKGIGTTTIYISHRMEEIYLISDKISVFRDGQHIITKNTAVFDEKELVSTMLGKSLESFFPKEQVELGQNILTVKNLSYKNMINDVSFSVKAGEIVSLVGAVGSGKTEILGSIYGVLKADGGEIYIDDNKLCNIKPHKAIKNGIALVPENRALEGIIGCRTVRDNMSSVSMDIISKLGIISNKKDNEKAQMMNDKLLVSPNDINYKITSLSGGNQQKIVIGKWLLKKYKLYLLDEVAAGVDIGAKVEIYKILGELVSSGAGVLLATGDIEEAMGLSDRLIILYKGRIIKEIDPKTTSKNDILKYIMGGGSDEN